MSARPLTNRLRSARERPPVLPPALRPWAWRITLAAFALAVLILPIAWSVRFSAQSEWWWERGFDIYDTDRRTGLPRPEVDRAGAALRAYFLSGAERAEITVTNAQGETEALFSEREVVHLIDVKQLLEHTFDAGWAAIGAIAAFLAGVWYWRQRRVRASLAQAGLIAGIGVTAVTAVIAVIAVTGFDGAFRQFHLLFFTNDLWQLSSRDRLIQMFPQGFFFQTTMLIGGATIAFAGGLALAGWSHRHQ